MDRLVSDVSVSLPSGASAVVPHGIRARSAPATPHSVMPNASTPILVESVDAENVTLRNGGSSSESAVFRCRYYHSATLGDSDQAIACQSWQGGPSGSTYPRLHQIRTGASDSLNSDIAAGLVQSGALEFAIWGRGGTGGCTLNVTLGGLNLLSYGVGVSEEWGAKVNVLRTGATKGIFFSQLGANMHEGNCDLDWSQVHTLLAECRRPISTGQVIRALVVKYLRL
jgi:hypothetical protein